MLDAKISKNMCQITFVFAAAVCAQIFDLEVGVLVLDLLDQVAKFATDRA